MQNASKAETQNQNPSMIKMLRTLKLGEVGNVLLMVAEKKRILFL